MVHSVGVKGTTVERWKRWNASYKRGETRRQVSVHAFVDYQTILQVLEWNMRAWHCAGKGNQTHIAFEICEPSPSKETPEVVQAIYARVLYLCVHLCKLYGLQAQQIVSHAEGHRLGIANNHADVGHWWGKGAWKGYSMDRLRADVAAALQDESCLPKPPESAPPAAQIPATLRKGSHGSDVVLLQKKLLALGYDLGMSGVDGKFGNLTRYAVKCFQNDKKLTVDGIVGRQTWRALLEWT